jgi:membrane-anchored protein YejM (alkaline phosphatase superfamily)
MMSLVQDFRDRGLLENTIVIVLSEMGRNRIYQDPAYSSRPGRAHWATTQFVLVAGSGSRPGAVPGATDRTSLRVTDIYYSPISYGPG